MNLQIWLEGLRAEFKRRGLHKQAAVIDDLFKTGDVVGAYGAAVPLTDVVSLKLKINGEEKLIELGGNSLESAITFGALVTLLVNMK
jgi:hypothetical protein